MSTLSEKSIKRLGSTTAELAPASRYVVGIATFRKGQGASLLQLLVLKRAPAETSFANMWEIPGGHVEPGETIRQTVKRETLEETALENDKVLGEFEEMHWTPSSSGTQNVQMNFAVAVSRPAHVRLNAEEHVEHRWVDKENAASLQATEAMKKVFADAFALARKNGIGASD